MRPLAAVTGRPLERLRGLTGRLARENALRKPGRTATTAAALMIGLALVVFVTIFAAGIKSSIAAAVDRNFRGELVIQNTDGFSPIPDGGGDAARQGPRRADGVVDPLRQVKVEGVGGKPRVSALDPQHARPRSCRSIQAGRPVGRTLSTCATTRRSSTSRSPTTRASTWATGSGC